MYTDNQHKNTWTSVSCDGRHSYVSIKAATTTVTIVHFGICPWYRSSNCDGTQSSIMLTLNVSGQKKAFRDAGACLFAFFPFTTFGLSASSFASFIALFFLLCCPHVFLHAAVHHFEDALDTWGTSHLLSCPLLGHNICHLSLLLPQTSFLVDTGRVKKRRDKNESSVVLHQQAAPTLQVEHHTSLAEPFSPSQRCPQC